MFPNLLGQKAYNKLSVYDMARIIGVSRPTYERKLATGSFTASECRKYMQYFHKSFEYLFATDEEIAQTAFAPVATSADCKRPISERMDIRKG